MQKLARTEQPNSTPELMYVFASPRHDTSSPSSRMRPTIGTTLQSKCVLLTNMFNPEECVDPPDLLRYH
jgi:hypothetical protein